MGVNERVLARVFRYDPSHDAAPRYEAYEVPYERDMRVLDVLDAIVEDQGVSLAYRWFCGVKRCGMCGVTVNGRPVLACWEAAEPEMVIEPLANFPVLRDLVVERDAFDRSLSGIEPYLQRRTAHPGFPEPITHGEMEGAYHLMDCIECLACTAACPVLRVGWHRFAGPAVLVQLAKFALDPRDGEAVKRASLALEAGVYDCVSCYACSDVCPQEISVLDRAIEPVRRLAFRHGAGGTHLQAFRESVSALGMIDPVSLMMKSRGLKSLDKLPLALKMMARGKLSRGHAVSQEACREIEVIRGLTEGVEP